VTSGRRVEQTWCQRASFRCDLTLL
jgi:hypothetical protein